MAFAAARRDSLADINITPLVDVMLVLLVIFMVTAPMLENRLRLTLPQASERVPPMPPETRLLAVEPGDVFTLDGAATTPARLTAALAEWHARVPDGVLRIEVAPDADYQSASTAFAAADRAGIEAIGLVEH